MVWRIEAPGLYGVFLANPLSGVAGEGVPCFGSCWGPAVCYRWHLSRSGWFSNVWSTSAAALARVVSCSMLTWAVAAGGPGSAHWAQNEALIISASSAMAMVRNRCADALSVGWVISPAVMLAEVSVCCSSSWLRHLTVAVATRSLPAASGLSFTLIAERYERRSLGITSNLVLVEGGYVPVEGWFSEV